MLVLTFVLLGTITLATSIVLPLVVVPFLRKRGVVDVPNHRSSHSITTIRGLGLAPLGAMVVGFMLLELWLDNRLDHLAVATVLAIAFFAGALGWLEDSVGLRIVTRAGLQLGLGIAGSAALLILFDRPVYLALLFGLGFAAYVL